MTATFVFETHDLDEMLDEGLDPRIFDGQEIVWHNGQHYPLTLSWGKLIARMTLHCNKCGDNPETFNVGSGLHNGAWCYVFGEYGEYIANLRDQSYVCANCATPPPADSAAQKQTARHEAFERRMDDEDNAPARQHPEGH